jgi:hypothetical protein
MDGMIGRFLKRIALKMACWLLMVEFTDLFAVKGFSRARI